MKDYPLATTGPNVLAPAFDPDAPSAERAPALPWMDAGTMTGLVPLPPGYRYEYVRQAEVPEVIQFLHTWFPNILVGAASCYLRESFYARHVVLADVAETHRRDTMVVLVRKGRELTAMFSAQRDRDTLALFGRLGAVAEGHRHLGIAESVMALTEPLARDQGMELAFGFATLHMPFMQMALERYGFRLVGITPGYDREMVSPGVVKRVYEALYVKVLAREGAMMLPDPANLTPTTRALFQSLFGETSA
jgi:hypothetical protein